MGTELEGDVKREGWWKRDGMLLQAELLRLKLRVGTAALNVCGVMHGAGRSYAARVGYGAA